MKKYLLTILFLILSIVHISCINDKQEVTSNYYKNIFESSPKFNYSNPSSLIKSYWSFLTWSDTANAGPDTMAYSWSAYTSDLKKYRSDNYNLMKKDYIDFRSKNEIEKIESQADLNVIVLTKELENKNGNYEDKKYLLIKENNKWLIDNILRLCWNCKGQGKERDYNYSYAEIYKTCPICSGLGWKSDLRFY